VTIYTDHNALTYLMGQAQPIARLQRWILTLDQYNINWIYRKGSSNAVADALSRRYQSAEESEQAQSELIKLEVVACFTQKGKWNKPWQYVWIRAVSTRSTNRDNLEIVPDLNHKNPRKPRKERQWKGSNPVSTWRERDAGLIRESQLNDSDLKVIIELLEHQPYSKEAKSLIGYFLKDGVLYIRAGKFGRTI
ncbi:MAG: hypothetical protein GY820_19195, partial [Gammaproteobacteria bacterium]|nr:hypothetical protein [Gammaproteobacteria bacterium]